MSEETLKVSDEGQWIKRHWLPMTLATIVLLALIWLSTAWIASLSNSGSTVGLASAGGFVISVVGLLVSFSGFALTLEQIALAREEVRGAKRESARIKLSLESYDSAHEASQAAYALKAASEYLKLDSLPQLASSYSDCCHSLVLIRENVSDLPEDIIEGIREAEAYIEGLCSRIDKKQVVPLDKSPSEMRRHSLLIKKIQIFLQRKAI